MCILCIIRSKIVPRPQVVSFSLCAAGSNVIQFLERMAKALQRVCQSNTCCWYSRRRGQRQGLATIPRCWPRSPSYRRGILPRPTGQTRFRSPIESTWGWSLENNACHTSTLVTYQRLSQLFLRSKSARGSWIVELASTDARVSSM